MKLLLPTITFAVTAFIMSPLAHGVVRAQSPQEENCENPTSETFLGLPTWYRYLEPSYNASDDSCDVSAIRDGDGNVDIGATVGAVLLAVTEVLLRIAGIVAVGFIVYGGILYTISQGEPERLGGARKTLINGVIGLVIAVFAVAIVNLLTNVLLP